MSDWKTQEDMTRDELITALAESSSWCARHVERIEELEERLRVRDADTVRLREQVKMQRQLLIDANTLIVCLWWPSSHHASESEVKTTNQAIVDYLRGTPNE